MNISDQFEKDETLPITRLFNLLIKSNMIYGETIKKTKPETLPFIYGTRHNNTIIDINYTILSIIKIFKLLKELKPLNKKILMIGNSRDIKFMLNNNFTKNNSSIIFLKKSWKHGLITNQSVKNKNRDKILEESLKKNEISLIIILKSSLYEPILLNELKNIKAPIIAVTNTNSNLRNIQYPILSSSNNIKTLYALLYVFRRLI